MRDSKAKLRILGSELIQNPSTSATITRSHKIWNELASAISESKQTKVVNINLYHSKAATFAVIHRERSYSHGSNPWLVVNKTTTYILISPKIKDKIRTCILVKKDIKLILVSSRSLGDRDV